jgi:hypothetical protein
MKVGRRSLSRSRSVSAPNAPTCCTPRKTPSRASSSIRVGLVNIPKKPNPRAFSETSSTTPRARQLVSRKTSDRTQQ